MSSAPSAVINQVQALFQLTQRFPRTAHRLESLVDRCELDDLEWLAGELLSTRSAVTLERALLQRLGVARA